ncbi:MAG: hypothetical protein CMA72_09870 [Euryarchaeota archaeon]|nr:hypothetical protein [Euryarchaeota archaeon]|tara:strand:+ start:686 stop:3376 length:2691 start_codon:yes stop_codon:yes gene_type:complete
MSTVNDLEVLEVLEQIKRNQKSKKGDQGPAGVGIETIEQFTDDSFTIRLTTGEFKKIQLPTAKDGEVGPQGIPGNSVTGPEGRRGPAGKDAAPARDGAPGRPGVSVTTGVVNADGNLLIALSDGTSINLGRVVGPAGATGERGPTGLPGAPGKDGSAVLSGPRTPTQDDGKEDDFWIDISSAEFNFYKKSGNGWSMLASLRQPGKNPAVAVPVGSGGSGGGGGGGKDYNTSNLPLTGFGRGPKGSKASINADGGNIIDPGHGLSYQSNLNKWVYESLQALDKGVPVALVDSPRPGAYEGELGFYQGDLYLWVNSKWEKIGGSGEGGASVEVGETPPIASGLGDLWYCTAADDLTLYVYDGAVWVPASPPVSLDGIQGDVSDLQAYIDTNITPALAGAVGDVRTLEAETARLGQGVDEAHQKADQLETELAVTTQTANDSRVKNIEQDGRLDALTEAQGQDERDITALRSRVGGTEAKNTEQDGRLDAVEAAQGSAPDGNFAELDGLNTFTRVNTFDARTVMNNHLTLQSDDDSHRLYIKNKTGETNLTLFPNGSISSKSHVNFTPAGGSTFNERYSSYIRCDTPPNWQSADGDFGLYVDISRGNTQQNRFVVGGRASREKAFEVYDDGKGRARVYGDFTADNKITTNTLQVLDEAAIKNAEFTGTCDVSNASHSNNCALPKSYFSSILKEFNSQFRSIYINHGTNGTSDPPIQIKASSSAGSLIELLNSSNQARFGINVHNSYMYGGTAAAPWIASSDHHFTTKKYVDRQVEQSVQAQNGPSGMWFKYGGQISEPRQGEFSLDSDELFIDCQNDDGVIWHAGATTTSLSKIWSHCTIYELNGRGEWSAIRMFQLEEFMFRTRNSRNHLRFGKAYQKFGTGLPTAGKRYLLNVAGFF